MVAYLSVYLKRFDVCRIHVRGDVLCRWLDVATFAPFTRVFFRAQGTLNTMKLSNNFQPPSANFCVRHVAPQSTILRIGILA